MDRDIVFDEVVEVVGEVYDDAWTNGNEVRVQLDEWGCSERHMTREAVDDLLDAREYTLREHGNSGYSHEIVNHTLVKLCGECEQNLMYDTARGEFYCPCCH